MSRASWVLGRGPWDGRGRAAECARPAPHLGRPPPALPPAAPPLPHSCPAGPAAAAPLSPALPPSLRPSAPRDEGGPGPGRGGAGRRAVGQSGPRGRRRLREDVAADGLRGGGLPRGECGPRAPPAPRGGRDGHPSCLPAEPGVQGSSHRAPGSEGLSGIVCKVPRTAPTRGRCLGTDLGVLGTLRVLREPSVAPLG